jgi:N-acetylglucosaminyldiphosphoundecaprenol N-acetyl-beta-D-mannosaminyltransferase
MSTIPETFAPSTIELPRVTTPTESRRMNVLGLPIDNVSLDEAVDAIMARVDAREPTRVAFINADCVNIAWNHDEYRQALCTADLNFGDGVGIAMAVRVLNHTLRANVNGTDLFPLLCEALGTSSRRVFLLGARPDVVAGVSRWIEKQYPGVNLCGVQHGYFGAAEEEAVIACIAKARPDVLLVAFGEPRQTLWLERHLVETGATVGIGVGGLFDFYSGRIPRAPQWMRRRGLEWIYRLYQEPRRLARRYVVGNVIFLARLATVWQRSVGRSGSTS